MPTYFVGSELDCFDVINGAPTESVTTANRTSYDRASIHLATSNDELLAHLTDPSDGTRKGFTDLWFHHMWTHGNGGVNGTGLHFQMYNSDGVPVFRLVGSSTNTLTKTFQRWNGTTWITVGTPWIYTTSVQAIADIKIKIHPTEGEIGIYVNGSQILSETGVDTSAMINIARFSLHRPSVVPAYVSQFLVASYCTIGHVVRKRTQSGNSSTNTAWTGFYTDVNSEGLADYSYIVSGTPGQDETHTAATLTSIGGSTIKAVAVSARLRRSESGPQNAKALLRIGSSNYAYPHNMTTLSEGYEARVQIWDTDPSNGSSWTPTNANAEFGLRSVE